MKRHEVIAGILLGTAGFALNWLKLTLFFNVDFLFGSVLSMFALLRFGGLAGILAAVIASTCTWFHWHHPWAVIIFSSEALCAAWLIKRKRYELMFCDIIYWFSGGLFLVWLFYHHMMGFAPAATLLVALKQGVNGIICTLLAEFIFLLSLRFAGGPLPTLHKWLRVILQVLVLAPIFVLAYFTIKWELQQQLTRLQQTTTKVAEVGRLSIGSWLSEEQHKVTVLAALVKDPNHTPPEQMQRIVNIFHNTHHETQRVGIMDREHFTRAFAPDVDEKGAPTLGLWLGDRPYISRLHVPGEQAFNQIFLGKIGKPAPRLITLAPISNGSTFLGAAFTVTSLEQADALLQGIVAKRQITLTILDNQRRVVASNSKDMKILEPFNLPANGKLQPAQNGISQWIPHPQPGISPMKRWLRSFYLTETTLPGSDFRLVVETSLAPSLLMANDVTSIVLSILAAMTLILIALTRYFSARLLLPIIELGKATKEIPAKITQREEVHWRPAEVREEQELQENFRLMANALHQTFDVLSTLNDELEQRVESRTVELQNSKEEWERTFDAMTDLIFIVDRDYRISQANQATLLAFNITREEIVGRRCCGLLHDTDSPPSLCPQHATLLDACPHMEELFIERLGRYFQISTIPIIDPQGIHEASVHVAHDITERKQAEAELGVKQRQLEDLNRSLQQRVDETIFQLRQKDQVLISQGRQAAMGEMIGNIAHQWRQPLNALSMLISNIQLAQQEKELTDEYLTEAATSADRLIKKMSSTINDFRNFFSPDKEKVSFSAREQIQHAVELVDGAFKYNDISVTIEGDDDCLMHGYPNEYSQVLLNLLSNAKDAIIGSGASPGLINITLKERDGMGVITVADNGGGIPEAVMDKIFEPYFSTKSMGTGIGLYMSKMIIERNMGGMISVSNIEGGCKFLVKAPLAQTATEVKPGS